jgi:hypothetical protein
VNGNVIRLRFWVVAVDNNVVGEVIKVRWAIANESDFVPREALSGNRART